MKLWLAAIVTVIGGLLVVYGTFTEQLRTTVTGLLLLSFSQHLQIDNLRGRFLKLLGFLDRRFTEGGE